MCGNKLDREIPVIQWNWTTSSGQRSSLGVASDHGVDGDVGMDGQPIRCGRGG